MPDNQQGKFRWVRHLFRPGKPLPGADDPPMYSWGDILSSLFMGVVMLPILGGFLILGLQAKEWWETAKWTPRPVTLWLDKPPEYAAKGQEHIVLWLLDFPQSGALMLLGLLLALCPLMFFGRR